MDGWMDRLKRESFSLSCIVCILKLCCMSLYCCDSHLYALILKCLFLQAEALLHHREELCSFIFSSQLKLFQSETAAPEWQSSGRFRSGAVFNWSEAWHWTTAR